MSSTQKGRFMHYSNPNHRTKVLGGSVSGSETDVSTSNENLSHEERYVIQNTPRQEPQGQENKTGQEGYNTLIIHEDSWNTRVHDVPPPMYKAPENCTLYNPSVQEITNIPDDYLSQSQVLKHLAKEVKVSGIDSSGENEIPSRHSGRRLRSKLSKSQPDLSALAMVEREKTILRHTLGNSRKDQQRCAQMVDHLMKENTSLKSELESCYHKVAKAHKLEEEVGKVTRAHEELVATCERRERLEHARIVRLQAEVRRLQEANQRLVTTHLLSPDHSRNQLAKREALIAQLVTQNKELVAAKERQEIELAAQRATLQEQRTHIDILDTALINAQGNVVRLEEECRQKQVHVERVCQLQRALSSLQLASDRREQTERKLRLQLEQELQNERAKHNNSQENPGNGEPVESLPELKRQLREKDEKIMRLEGEVAKWEQKYLEESQLRQAAIDAASIPKDAKIAALEKTSQETEKLIAEARSDRIRQMDEVHAAQKRVTDLEAKVKELECKLAERDAMIRVLQNKHTLDKEVSSSYPSISLSHHPSLNTTDLNVLAGDDLGGVSTTSVFSTVSSALTSSTGFGSDAPYTGSVDSYHHKFSSPAESYHKSLDDQLKDQLDQLDSQLLSKRGFCCFPGFSHPGSSSRKGKIPQPLLASVGGFESGGFLQGLVGSGNRPDDMELLEKQGLCSQQQRQAERCASLPPSSLPRPKRNKTSSRDRKLGEYGRLSDSETTAKISNNSSSDTTGTRRGDSPSRIIPLAGRKLGEYGRLSDPEDGERKMSVNSNSDSEIKRRDSPARSMMAIPPRNYSRLSDNENSRKILNNTSSDNSENKIRDQSARTVVPLPPHNYTRLPESTTERKMSTSTTPEAKENQSQRDSPNRLMLPKPPRKLGEYGRLSDGEGSSRKNSGTSSTDETHMVSNINMRPPLMEKFGSREEMETKKQDSRSSSINRSPVRKTVEFGKQISNTEIRMTPVNKFPHYSRLDEVGKTENETSKSEPRPLLPLSNLTTKLPTRSFLPPPKKLSDYGCFEQQPNKQDSKLRLLPTGRRGSLHREQTQQKPGGVRSLPTPNKYRIQF